jgi:hypothetical protein
MDHARPLARMAAAADRGQVVRARLRAHRLAAPGAAANWLPLDVLECVAAARIAAVASEQGAETTKGPRRRVGTPLSERLAFAERYCS